MRHLHKPPSSAGARLHRQKGSFMDTNLDETPVRPESAKPVRPKTVKRSRWVRNVSAGDNLHLYERLMRIFLNLVDRYPGRLNDTDTFAPIQYLMCREKALELFATCTTESVRKNMCRESRYNHSVDPDDPPPTRELMSILWKNPKSNPKFKRLLRDWLEHAATTLTAWQMEHPDPVTARIAELRSLFSLSDPEIEALTLEIILANGIWPSDDFRKPNSFQKVTLHSKLLNMKESEYLRLIDSKSKLRRLGCLDHAGAFNTDLLHFLSGMDSDPLASRFYKRNEVAPLPWTFFGSLAENDGALLKQMVASRDPAQGMNILLYGEPGTGKTSFAVSLAAELGLTPYFVAHCDADPDRPRANTRAFRFTALQICAGQIDPQKSLVVIDEADSLLSCGSDFGMGGGLALGGPATTADKGRLNDALDTLRLPCIWITNTPAEVLDPSNCRRFDYSVQFDTLNQSQREAIWRNALGKHGLGSVFEDTAPSRFAARYEVSAGGIDLALRNLGAMLKAGHTAPADAGRVVERILANHCKLLNIQSDGQSGIRPDYTLDGLNIKGEVTPRQIESAIRRFLDEQAAGVTQDQDRPRMNMLLAGPSGTGKTEFVKYLGAALRTQIVTRMGSDLLNKYVGGTERKIRQAFEQAAAERAILFLDEADGLLQSRERAERSWEVTQVNELLHQMENFDGVLICATNFASRLDSATLRRFTFKLEFDFLSAEGKQHFFNRLFATFGVNDLTAEEDLRLTRIHNLTPGDYRTVRQSLYYLGTNVTAASLLSALERESATKRGKPTGPVIGFKTA